ncbi:MAG: sulfatase [Planctomycetaceae bacterium]|nr:sulfatase [Planctomycetaceae bacterium]
MNARPRLPLIFISLLCLLPCNAKATDSADSTAKRPNILWIVGENFDLDFGCYGAKNVLTPNIDRLAANGIRYTNVFSTSPVCAPSRSCFMTGMYATTTDMHHMRSHRDDDYRLPTGVRPITQRLHDIGYTTANIKTIGDHVVGTGKLDLNFTNEGELYTTTNWSELKQQQPFFAQINMPEAEYDIYDRKSSEKDRVVWVGEEWHPQVATAANVNPPPYYPDHPIVRAEWARYLNSASGMDVRIGWILDQLQKDGLADNTVIIFFADNGRLEARGIHWCFDSGLHVPMVVHWPKNIPAPDHYRAGSLNNQVISLMDLTATTLSIAGIQRPDGMQSRVFLGNQPDPPRQYAFSARDRIDETIVRQRSVRGPRYHYVRNFTPGAGFLTLNRYKEKCFLVKPLMRELHTTGQLTGAAKDLMQPFPTEQLYDTLRDPFEIHNLADSRRSKPQRVLESMRTALDTWMVQTGDLGHIPEPDEIVRPFTKEMHDWFGTPDWYTPDKQ